MKFFQPKVHVVYAYEYFLGLCEKGPRATFDCKKFQKIRNALLKQGIMRKRHILEAYPVAWDDLKLVHDSEYLESLRNPEVLARLLFLDYVNPFDTDILEFFLWVTGGTIRTLHAAYETGIPTFNLGGGFHHAKPAKGEGFCPVNDVAVAARVFQRNYESRRLLIVDLDYHQGNGTALIFEDDDSVFTYSMHRDTWDKIKGSANLDVELTDGIGDEGYLENLAETLPPVLESFRPDLVIYLAGADPFVRDTLGTFELTEQGILNRDRFVSEQCFKRDLPLAVVAGGGYGPESWKLYFNYIRWAVKGISDV